MLNEEYLETDSKKDDLRRGRSMLCSVKDAARTLGIGRTKLYELLADNELSSIRIGTRRLIHVESIERLVGQNLGGAA